MIYRDTEKDRPTHSVEQTEDHGAASKPGGHEVEPPKERVDDEVGSDEPKTTQRQE